MVEFTKDGLIIKIKTKCPKEDYICAMRGLIAAIQYGDKEVPADQEGVLILLDALAPHPELLK